MAERIEEIVGELIDDRKFVVTLGGEHTVAVGAARAYAKRTPAIQMMVYWDGGGQTFSGCDFSIKSGQPAYAAFKAVGLDPYFERY